jgi:hypothetical protein
MAQAGESRPTNSGEIRPWWQHPYAVLSALALAVSLLCFGWTLDGHFLSDDFGYIGRFHAYPFAQWPRLFVEGWAGDMWGFQLRELRPITALTFMVDARLWDGNALGYRVTNLLLHAGCATAVGLLAWRAAGRDFLCGGAAAVLFALHPVHAEPVQWITGRVDVLTTLLYLAGFLAFLRYRSTDRPGWSWLFGACYAAAAFAKEFGLTLPLMCLVADAIWLGRGKRWGAWRTWLPYAIGAVVVMGYFFSRRAAFGPGAVGTGMPNYTGAEFQLLTAQRQLIYLGNLFPPLERWWFEGAPLLQVHAGRIIGIVAGTFAVALAAWCWSARQQFTAERRATLFFGLGWYLVATVPLVVTYISPRHLYLASAGVCVGLALLLHGLLRSRCLFALATCALAALYIQRLPATMRPWHDAAVVSGKISRELSALEPLAGPGAALLLDVPEIRGGAYVWTWAVPFALRPPFTRGRLDERAIVLESRGLYVDWGRWHEQPAVELLQRTAVDGWIVQIEMGQPLRRIPVTAARVREVAARFAKAPLTTQPHESWRAMVNALAAP